MKRLLLALVLVSPFTAMAADKASDKDPFTQGSAKAGESKAAVCAACHGPGGNSAMPDWPKLAGQGSSYIAGQLKDFKSGKRNNPIMAAQVINLTDADFADLGAYYGQQKVTPGLADKAAVATAEPLYRAGDAARGIPACASCHGPKGTGNPAAGYPHVGGQHAKYTATQLTAYKSGERAGTPNGQIMAAVASKLTEQEIQALSSYLNGLH